jgi:hypothetical protein
MVAPVVRETQAQTPPKSMSRCNQTGEDCRDAKRDVVSQDCEELVEKVQYNGNSDCENRSRENDRDAHVDADGTFRFVECPLRSTLLRFHYVFVACRTERSGRTRVELIVALRVRTRCVRDDI